SSRPATIPAGPPPMMTQSASSVSAMTPSSARCSRSTVACAAAGGYVCSGSCPAHPILSAQLPAGPEVGTRLPPVAGPARGVADRGVRVPSVGFATEALDEVPPGCRQTPGQRNPHRSGPCGLGAAQRSRLGRGQCAAGGLPPGSVEQLGRGGVTGAGRLGDVGGEFGEQTGPVAARVEPTRPGGRQPEASDGGLEQDAPVFVDAVMSPQGELEPEPAEPR